MRASMGMLCHEAGLSPTECRVLLLYAEEGLAYEEIAERLGISSHAVRCHASNGGRKIRDHYHGREQLEELREALRGETATLPEPATSGP